MAGMSVRSLSPDVSRVGGRFKIRSEIHPVLLEAANTLLQQAGIDATIIADPVNVLRRTLPEDIPQKLKDLGFSLADENPTTSSYCWDLPKRGSDGDEPLVKQWFQVHHGAQALTFWADIVGHKDSPSQQVSFTPEGTVVRTAFKAVELDEESKPHDVRLDGGLHDELLKAIAETNPAFRGAMVTHLDEVIDPEGTSDIPGKLRARGFKPSAEAPNFGMDYHVELVMDPAIEQRVYQRNFRVSSPAVTIYTSFCGQDEVVKQSLVDDRLLPRGPLKGHITHASLRVSNSIEIYRENMQGVRVRSRSSLPMPWEVPGRTLGIRLKTDSCEKGGS